MAETDILLIRSIIFGAFLAIILPALLSFFYGLWCRKKPERRKRAGISAILVFSGFLLLAIGLLRYAVGYFAIASPLPEAIETPLPMLNKIEQALNSLFIALRTFGLEEEYEPYILSIREMLDAVIPADTDYGAVLRNVVVSYATILNLAAPIAGGAIILEVMASIFPKVRLRWTHGQHWREKCYFSELSPASLALAKSLNTYYVKTLHKAKPVLIFTDVYVDKAEEKEFELLVEAKQLGAICVRSDLAHVPKPLIGKRNYFLMEESEFGNMQMLTNLTEGRNIRYIKKSRIYLFVQTDAYVQLERQIHAKLQENGVKDKKMPLLIPVNAYRNLVHNLLVDVPLYEPLVSKADPGELTVTILGNGLIGTEAFLSAYWFGQMLVSRKTPAGALCVSPCKVTVNVVSKDTPEVFWSKIDYINPEIKATVKVVGEEEEKKPCLRYNDAGDETPPYCTVNYVQADVKNGSFWDPEARNTASLLTSDYFVVALGNDGDNISVAQKLRSFIGQKHWKNRSQAKTVVAYAVFDPQLSEVLNDKNHRQSGNALADVYMHAFGNLDQVYSSDNVFMANSLVLAEETNNAYLKQKSRDAHLQDNLKRRKNEDKNYSHWANIARTMHLKYKVFSLGWITTSVFDTPIETHRNNVKNLCAAYRRIASLSSTSPLSREDSLRRQDMEAKKHCLAWVEHRRWCAFTRTMGYQTTDTLQENLLSQKSYKNMPLKLHPCLVEARLPILDKNNTYILASFRANGKMDTFQADTERVLRTENGADYLDKLSYGWKKIVEEARVSGDPALRDCVKGVDYYDFKLYDYYRYEFTDNMLASEFAAWNCESGEPRFPKLCGLKPDRLRKRIGARNVTTYTTDQGTDLIVPVGSFHKYISRSYVPAGDAEQAELCRENQVPGAFCFDDTWYATQSAWAAERNEKNA